jgi:hypothetical protein
LAANWQQIAPIVPVLPANKYCAVYNLPLNSLHGMEEVIGSIPIMYTNQINDIQEFHLTVWSYLAANFSILSALPAANPALSSCPGGAPES